MAYCRIGTGYDIHRLSKGRKLILGGIQIPYEKGLLGHSDADVLVHSVMDAMLGALSLGDIGLHFPPSDNQYSGIDSLKLLALVKKMIEVKSYRIGNIDCTIQAEKPKLLDYIIPMRKKLAEELSCPLEDISLKATTMEGLGAIGKGKAIAAQSVVILYKD